MPETLYKRVLRTQSDERALAANEVLLTVRQRFPRCYGRLRAIGKLDPEIGLVQPGDDLSDELLGLVTRWAKKWNLDCPAIINAAAETAAFGSPGLPARATLSGIPFQSTAIRFNPFFETASEFKKRAERFAQHVLAARQSEGYKVGKGWRDSRHVDYLVGQRVGGYSVETMAKGGVSGLRMADQKGIEKGIAKIRRLLDLAPLV
ncbi:MAG: hypothetical protein ABL986_24030 [Vicinamibacterales bacterium]